VALAGIALAGAAAITRVAVSAVRRSMR
jgi:hypothetical protein